VLPEFGTEAIGAKYKGVSGEAMTPSERATWEKIRELASRFQKAERIVLGIPMWKFSFPYKLKQLIDLACQRNMLFTFDGKEYGPALNMELAHDVFVVPVTRAMIERLLGKLHENEDILICAPFYRGDSVNPVTILECLATIGATPQELVRPGATMRRVGSLELDLIERTARGERPIELLPREYRLLD
jgi:hypothetical protein